MYRFFVIIVATASLLPVSASALTGDGRCLANPTHSCVFDLMVQSVLEIEDTSSRYSLLEGAIDHLMDAGAVDRALEVGRLIDDLHVRLRAIRPLRHHLTTEVFDSARANKLLNDEVAHIQEELRTLDEEADFRTTIALDFAWRGSMARALREAAEIELAGRRIATLSEIAVIAFGAGDLSSGNNALDDAWQAAGELADLVLETSAMHSLIATHLQFVVDRDVVVNALAIPFLRNRVYALMRIARHQFELGREDAAFETLAIARDSAIQGEGAWVAAPTRAGLLEEIANQQGEFGDLAAYEHTHDLASAIWSAELERLEPIVSVLPGSSDAVSSALRFALALEDVGPRALALSIIVAHLPSD